MCLCHKIHTLSSTDIVYIYFVIAVVFGMIVFSMELIVKQ